MATHEVKQGECISSIAAQYGLPWKAVWGDPGNSDLRQRRKSPSVLAPGDVIQIPELKLKKFSVATGSCHTFVLDRQEVLLRLKLREGAKPIANVRWTLEVDGQELSGTTSGDGLLEAALPPAARLVTLRLEKRSGEFAIDLGGLDPVTEISGLQARLFNLGYFRRRVDGVLGSATVQAIKEFQSIHKLTVNGEPDDQTRKALVDAHGC